MKRARFVSAAVMAVALSACSLLPDEPAEKAQAAFEAQDYLTAHDFVQAALAHEPRNPAALELLARIQLAMGQGGDVAATLDRLERAGGEPQDLPLIAAEGKLQDGDAEAALRLIGEGQSAEAWRLRALAAAMKGDEAGALEAYRRGREAGGNRARLLAAEASYQISLGNIDAAADAVARARQVAPDRVETRFVTARLAEARGDHLLALSNFLQIVEKVPRDRPALVSAIAAAERAGKPDIVRHLIAYGAQTRPLDREFVYQQARVLAWDGEWSAVRERLQAHEAELLDHDPARLLYAESLLQLGQLETARAIAAPVIARRRGDEEAMRLEAAIEAAGS